MKPVNGGKFPFQFIIHSSHILFYEKSPITLSGLFISRIIFFKELGTVLGWFSTSKSRQIRFYWPRWPFAGNYSNLYL